ncbi:FtsX-like permease family protein [Rheinheimera sp. F8]|uniref:ABC transporter permease n=1 Tax=Rheinheimera sp. F8 TaxID=1763998 RepID=UPI000744B66D|nr:FtsX-like permease family protein [Rheinheimera sp. F8]ALZ77274.1 cell division protein FtsX [Rheinheimera sp. F8]
MLELGPMIRALMRNKIGALLIALQIALTLTIMVNAIFMMQERNRQMARASGVDEQNTFYLSNTVFGENYPLQSALARDLDQIRKTPGVVAATQINAIPLSGGGWSMGLQTKPGDDVDGTGTAIYFVDTQGIAALGVELLAGENFSESDIGWRERSSNKWPPKIIITQTLAEKLFDGDWKKALGQTVYINNHDPMQVTGIVKSLQSPWNGWDNTEHASLVPSQLENKGSRIFIRTEPGRRDALMPVIEKMLADSDKQRIIRNVKTMSETRDESYREHQATNNILLTVIIVLTLITGFGIVGLAMFSINRRTRQIGTRRALGASQWQIMRFFMLENLLISSLGVVLGIGGAVGLNIWLVSTFAMTPLTPGLLLVGCAALLLVGQLAVSYPALIAARISPATATRGRA